MEYKEFFKRLKEKNLPSCMLLHGQEEYIKEQALRQLRSAFLPEGMEAMNEGIFDGTAEENAIIEGCEMLPFMADKRLVIVRDHPLVTSVKAAGDGSTLSAYIKEIPSHVLLVFYVRGAADTRKRVSQAIGKNGMVLFGELSEGDLYTYLRREAAALGKDMQKDAMERLVFLCGRDLTGLTGELQKVCAYAQEREQITVQDVEAMATPTLESSVFQFVDSIVGGRGEQALSTLARLMYNGESPIMILAVMARNFRQLHHAKLLQGQGMSGAQMEKILGVSGYVAGLVGRQAQGCDGAWLARSAQACVQADYEIKSGVKRENAALEDLVLALLHRNVV